jgi:Plasmid pRiA4b ORF-3-like protein
MCGVPGRAARRVVVWPDEAPAEAGPATREPRAGHLGWRPARADQGLAAGRQPDGVAARAGAGRLHPARVVWRVSGRDGVGGHPPLSIPSARRSVRLLGTVGVFAGCVLGGASAPQGSAVCLRVRPEHPWRHEVRIEARPPSTPGKTYPTCTSGNGACPPEDCGGPASFMDGRDDMLSLDALDDLDTMVEIVGQVAWSADRKSSTMMRRG